MDSQTASCAGLLKVLSDETRLAVVRLLLEEPRRVGQLSQDLHVEQSLLSHHLKVLREAGLVETQRDGKSVLYSLSPSMRRRARGEAIDLGCCLISFAGR
ncbi:MAG: ArsR family transcriptional regulator [Planctomycetota bacterium]|nr:MAG: ArsR family transcriptional regulator [Planctomycetota bacterium]